MIEQAKRCQASAGDNEVKYMMKHVPVFEPVYMYYIGTCIYYSHYTIGFYIIITFPNVYL